MRHTIKHTPHTYFYATGLILVLVMMGCSPGCFLKPDARYDAATLSHTPDYSNQDNWAALPTTEDQADFVPKGEVDSQDTAKADTFYVYPTAWFDKEIWNDTLANRGTNEVVDEILMASQASVFNRCCRVYAPRYRQTSIVAFYGETEDAQLSFEVAYSDVKRAFETFIRTMNDDRPFIIASHSQGSMHAMRLLAMIDADESLRSRMVAAYVPGFALPDSFYGTEYKHLKPCESATQTGCIASWNTFKEGSKITGLEPLQHWKGDRLVKISPEEPRQCTNPITWSGTSQNNTGKPSDIEQHLGAVEMINSGEDISFTKYVLKNEAVGVDITGLKAPRAKMLSATCEGGVLRVPDVGKLDWPEEETERGNYHLMDYELFYMDVRANAVQRVEAFLSKNTPAPPQEP